MRVCSRVLNLPMRFTILTCLVALLASCAGTQHGNQPDTPVALDRMVKAEREMLRLPAVSVAVRSADGATIARAYGAADVERGIPATSGSVFPIASLTKPITATAVLLLADSGKLTLDDRIGDVVPDLPTPWRPVTIRQLLQHTSGLPNYTDRPDIDERRSLAVTPADMLSLVRDLPVESAPGERYAYSNTNYVLLGLAIEARAGVPLERFLADRVFTPLRMTRSRLGRGAAAIDGRVVSYERDNKRLVPLRRPEHPTWEFAAGGVYSTATDLLRFVDGLEVGRLLSAARLAEMLAPGHLASGAEIAAGMGWGLETFHGHRLVHGAGSKPGAQGAIVWFPDDDLVVTVVASREGAASAVLARKIAALYLPDVARALGEESHDDAPELTARLRSTFRALLRGASPVDAFGERGRAQMFPDGAIEISRGLGPLGDVDSFTLVSRKPVGDRELRSYRVVIAGEAFLVQFGVSNGLIDGMSLLPF